MDVSTRVLVRQRAGDRCEYCRLPQRCSPLSRFQIEHVIPRKHGGSDDLNNLALSCDRCNLHKGPNLSGIDPANGEIVALFNPREQTWEDHFQFDGALVSGRTATGRTSVVVLNMNSTRRLRLRAELLESGEFG